MLDEKSIICLRQIDRLTFPAGSKYLSSVLDIPQGTIGKILIELESKGYLVKESNKGRLITSEGKAELEKVQTETSQLRAAVNIVNTVKFSTKEKLIEVLEIRRLLEGHIIKDACTLATDSEMLELNRIMLEHMQEIEGGGLGNVQDFQLHTSIAKMSRNQIVYEILVLILTKENASTKFSIVADHVLDIQAEQHQRIVKAITNRNVEEAQTAMDVHLLTVMSDVDKYYAEHKEDKDSYERA